MHPALKKERQAVIVIHGVGEQRPMDTLRSFIESVLGIDPKEVREPGALPSYYSRPDTFSGSFELRRLSTTGNFRPRTDFFELYWAHKMPAATWDRLIAWLRLLLFRSHSDVPRPLRGLWWTTWIFAVLAGALLLASIVFYLFPNMRPVSLRASITMPLGVIALLTVVQSFILSYVGDAAVYLSPVPRNIEARHEIRVAGVALLDRLHDSEEFDRIIIVGHSLGSVIGYDILTHAWQKYCTRHGCVDRPSRERLRLAEELASSMRNKMATEREGLRAKWMIVSRELWLEQRANGCPWLVTDFVTLGSPLAHADLLLAADRADFSRKAQQRELPTCPPIGDHNDKLAYSFTYELPGSQQQRSIYLLHHAACFAVTRWSNLYFPSLWLLKGDFIGGPLSELFGGGIEDRAVQTTVWNGFLSHTLYWRRQAGSKISDHEPISALREALDLQRRTFQFRYPS